MLGSNYSDSDHNKTDKCKYNLRSWLFIIISLLAIAGFSNQEFERQDLSGRIACFPNVTAFVRDLPQVRFDYYNNGKFYDNHSDPVGFIQFIIRKLGHLFLYAFLSCGLLVSLRKEGKISRWGGCRAALLVLLVAGVDEFNQTLVLGRSGSVKDIGVDMTAFLLVLVIMFIRKREGRTAG